MAKKRANARHRRATDREREGVSISLHEQNDQIAEAAETAGNRRTSAFGRKDKGSAQKLPGKKFDEWVWYSPDNEEIKIPVRVVQEKELHLEDYQTLAGSTARTYFQVVMPEYVINEYDTDIEELRGKVFAAIEKPFEISWTNVLVIEISGQDHPLKWEKYKDWELREPSSKQFRLGEQVGLGGKIEISLAVERWEIGTTRNGRKVSRKRDSERNNHIRKGWPEAVEAGENFSGFYNKVVLPDTEDNRTALEALIQGLSAFREKLDELIHPERAEKLFRSAANKLARAITGPRKPNA